MGGPRRTQGSSIQGCDRRRISDSEGSADPVVARLETNRVTGHVPTVKHNIEVGFYIKEVTIDREIQVVPDVE
jgi:hypothetical protein